MEILIRKATKEDAQAAIPLIMEAIGDISMHMTGETEEARNYNRISKLVYTY